MNYINGLNLENLVASGRKKRIEISQEIKKTPITKAGMIEVIQEVGKEFNVSRPVLFSKDRISWLISVRKFCAWLLRMSGHTYEAISDETGMHHTTILHHYNTFPEAFVNMEETTQDTIIKIIKKWQNQQL